MIIDIFYADGIVFMYENGLVHNLQLTMSDHIPDENKLSRLPPWWSIPIISAVCTVTLLLPEDLRNNILIPAGLLCISTGVPVGWFWLLTVILIWLLIYLMLRYAIHHDFSDQQEEE